MRLVYWFLGTQCITQIYFRISNIAKFCVDVNNTLLFRQRKDYFTNHLQNNHISSVIE